MHTVYAAYGYAGDAVHLMAALLLIAYILHRRSCQGLSGRMQILYAMVVTTRYVDLIKNFTPVYAVTGVCFIFASYFTCYLMYGKYSKTVEREFDSFWIETCIISSIALAFLYVDNISNPINVFWTFSRYLEATVVIPQMYFDCKSYNKINRVVFLYIFLLICYRALYLYNWVITDQWNRFLVYPAIAQISVSALYYFIVCIFPSHQIISSELEAVDSSSDTDKQEDKQLSQISVISRTALSRQLSLLETPFLNRSQTSTSSLKKLVDQGSDSDSSPTVMRSSRSFVVAEQSGSMNSIHKSSSTRDFNEFERRQRY